MKPNIAFITSGYLPIPPTKGGAVENLVGNLLKQNVIHNDLQFSVYSAYDKDAALSATDYPGIAFHFIKIHLLIQLLDKCIYWFASRVVRVSKNMSYRYILQRLYYLNKVKHLISKTNYDYLVFENHASIYLTLKSKKNATKYQGKIIFHLHNEILKDYGCAELIIRSHIFTVSHYIAETVKKRYPQIQNDHIHVLRNCVGLPFFQHDANRIKAVALRDQFGIGRNEKVILFSGRLTQQKGVKEALLGFIKADLPDTRFLIVGDYFFASGMSSPYEKELHELICSVSHKVLFTGYLSYEKMPAVYAMSYAAVLPSLWNEPASLAIIEAVVSGIPLITTATGGTPEYVNPGYAYIFDVDEQLENQIAEALADLCTDEEKRCRMSDTAILFTQNLTDECYYRSFIELLADT